MEVDLFSDSCPGVGRRKCESVKVPSEGQETRGGRTVNEGPHATDFSLAGVDGVDKVLSDSVHQKLELLERRRPEFPSGLLVARSLDIVEQRDSKQQRVVDDGVPSRVRLLELVQTGRKEPGVVVRHGGEEVEASLGEVKVFEGRVGGESLKSKVANPESSVSSGTVLEDGVHAAAQGVMGDLVDPSESLSVVLADLGVRGEGEDRRVLERGRTDGRCEAVLEPRERDRSASVQDLDV